MTESEHSRDRERHRQREKDAESKGPREENARGELWENSPKFAEIEGEGTDHDKHLIKSRWLVALTLHCMATKNSRKNANVPTSSNALTRHCIGSVRIHA